MTVEPDCETSLSGLSEHDWNVLSSRWSRGIDWCVEKIGPRWAPLECFGSFPLCRTKTEAYQKVTTLVLWESRHRAKVRNATPPDETG